MAECSEVMELEMVGDEGVSQQVDVCESAVREQVRKCLLCDGTTEPMKTVQKVGLDQLLKDCERVGRVDVLEYVRDGCNAPFNLHCLCRVRLYNEVRRANKVASTAAECNRKRTRVSTGTFNYKTTCLFCSNREIVGFTTGPFAQVRTFQFVETTKACIVDRGHDPWALQVLGRIEGVNDLIAADAVYHHNCYKRFLGKMPLTPKKVKRGRPVNVEAKMAFDALCDELESSGENEIYTLHQLCKKMTDLVRAIPRPELENSDCSDEDIDVYSKKWLRQLLKERYGDNVYFASRPGQEDVIGFKGVCDLIVNDTFFDKRASGEGTEAEKTVRKAAALILAEIRETEYERNYYPTADDITGDGFRFIPPLLKLFIQRLITRPTKQVALGQGLVQAAKPNGCIMPLLFGVGVEVEKLAQSHLHEKLATLGFSTSYAEIRRYKHSIMRSQAVDNDTDSDSNVRASVDVPYTQFVADNLDHNVKTLDGLSTFHGMGIISATVRCAGTFSNVDRRVRRCEKMKVAEVVADKTVPIVRFEQCCESKLDHLQLKRIRELSQQLPTPALLTLNSLWQACGILNLRTFVNQGQVLSNFDLMPNWSGFMQTACSGEHPGVSTVDMLSVVDLNPSDDDCINSTLLFVIDQAKKLRLPTACITFDQPLYIKAVDISMRSKLDIVVRLGGFHTLMSFLGSVGRVMRGSGLEDVLGLMFGPNTIEHVLTGKAYARAIRGHFLISSALCDILFQYLAKWASPDTETAVVLVGDIAMGLAGCVNDTVLSELRTLLNRAMTDKVNADDCDWLKTDSLVFLTSRLDQLKGALSEQSRTARLWVRYMEHIDLVKTFLFAERTSNWLLHLHTLERMLPLFAAAGHGNYAKSVRVYLQQMHQLPQSHPWLYEQFLRGNHTIRRSDRYWSGLSCDLVIEQAMMRNAKSQGGLTHGRGMSENVRATWLSTLAECSTMHAAMTQVTSTQRPVNDHVDTTKARMTRDWQDLMKIVRYLSTYSPFRFTDSERVISLASGIASASNDGINCDLANEVGFAIHEEWDNKQYCVLKLEKRNKVKTMLDLTKYK